ncbi:MAG: acyltransferase family protein [Synergistaceae bacterium]|nr:acyltransferase family protein [Synergistaceae bacterium]
MTPENRTYYFDFLRVAACFAVIVRHVAEFQLDIMNMRVFDWQVLVFYDGALVRWAVPIFVMISGALFLKPGKNIPVKTIYSKYVLRIATALVFWSFIYAAGSYVNNRDIVRSIDNFIRGHYHLWFLFMIMGLYMILPLFRHIAESEFLTKYFLILALIFTYILPECADIVSLFSEEYASSIGGISENFHMYFTAGFTGFFLLGHFLNQADITPKAERWIYFAGLCSFAVNGLMLAYVPIITGKPYNPVYVAPKIWQSNIFVTIAVFVFFKRHCKRENMLVRRLSQYSFGAFLVHAIVIVVLQKLGLHSLTFNPVFSVPVISVIVCIISFGISAVLNHIPVLNKYIV